MADYRLKAKESLLEAAKAAQLPGRIGDRPALAYFLIEGVINALMSISQAIDNADFSGKN
jgi:hypothetical protein